MVALFLVFTGMSILLSMGFPSDTVVKNHVPMQEMHE